MERDVLGTRAAWKWAGATGRALLILGPVAECCSHKEIEENNRMRKTRDLFKKIRDTKGIFHAKMGSTPMASAGNLS